MRLHAALLALLLVPFAASAHLAGGNDVKAGSRILDFGFDPEVPVAGQPLTVAFNVADVETKKAIAPDSVWVRITDDDALVFAGTLLPSGGNVTLSMLAPTEGEYEVAAHYLFGEEKAEATFPLRISAASTPPTPPAKKPPLLPYAAFAAVGAYVGFALGRGTNRRSSPHH